MKSATPRGQSRDSGSWSTALLARLRNRTAWKNAPFCAESLLKWLRTPSFPVQTSVCGRKDRDCFFSTLAKYYWWRTNNYHWSSPASGMACRSTFMRLSVVVCGPLIVFGAKLNEFFYPHNKTNHRRSFTGLVANDGQSCEELKQVVCKHVRRLLLLALSFFLAPKIIIVREIVAVIQQQTESKRKENKQLFTSKSKQPDSSLVTMSSRTTATTHHYHNNSNQHHHQHHHQQTNQHQHQHQQQQQLSSSSSSFTRHNIPCKYYSSGKCVYGSDCRFLHIEKVKILYIFVFFSCFRFAALLTQLYWWSLPTNENVVLTLHTHAHTHTMIWWFCQMWNHDDWTTNNAMKQ